MHFGSDRWYSEESETPRYASGALRHSGQFWGLTPTFQLNFQNAPILLKLTEIKDIVTMSKCGKFEGKSFSGFRVIYISNIYENRGFSRVFTGFIEKIWKWAKFHKSCTKYPNRSFFSFLRVYAILKNDYIPSKWQKTLIKCQFLSFFYNSR